MASLAELISGAVSRSPMADIERAKTRSKAAVDKFVDYELNPESRLKPNERLRPGLMQGWRYDLRPGETMDDQNRVIQPDGTPATFVDRPQLATIADIIGFMTGGVAGAPKGALGSGAYRTVRDVGPSILAEDLTAVRELALRMEAMHKRGAQGYQINDPSVEGLAKADKALTRVSTKEPLPRYQDSATRALDMGFDTPAFHITNVNPDPEVLRKLAGTPFSTMDPFVKNRGSMYFGNFENPMGPLQTGAAQFTHGDVRAYPYMLKDVMGEHPMLPGLYGQMPDTLQFGKFGEVPGGTLGDIRDAMQATPGWGDNMGAAMEAAKEYFGKGFDPATFLQKQGTARNDVAEMLARLYYEPVPGGAPGSVQKIDPMAYRPADPSAAGLPGFSAFESGARQNKPGSVLSGLHSPIQNEIGAIGFSGARVKDEMRKIGGKSYAMIDPTGVRAVGAKFKDPFGDLLSAHAPPSWWVDLWQQGNANDGQERP